jgi:predicted nucleic acid-binding protein
MSEACRTIGIVRRTPPAPRRGRKPFPASVALAELHFGIGVRPDRARKDRLARSLDSLLALLPGRTWPFDADAARRDGPVEVDPRAAGRPLTMADGTIAATAAASGFAVATRRVRHFEAIGIELIDPWQNGRPKLLPIVRHSRLRSAVV